MPDFVEKEAKTVDEAIQLALDELNIELEDADVEILEEGSKAKLGIFGGKGAKVRVTVNIPDTKIVANFLDEIINRSRSEDDYPKYVITEKEEDGVKVIKVQISGKRCFPSDRKTWRKRCSDELYRKPFGKQKQKRIQARLYRCGKLQKASRGNACFHCEQSC